MADLSSNVQITLSARDEASAQVQALQASLSGLQQQQQALSATIKDASTGANAYIEAETRLKSVEQELSSVKQSLVGATKASVSANKEAEAAVKAHAEAHKSLGLSVLAGGLALEGINKLVQRARNTSGVFLATQQGNRTVKPSRNTRHAVLVGMSLQFFKESTKAAIDYQRSVEGLNTIGAEFGQTTQQTNQALHNLTSDGLLSTTQAATALREVMQKGFSADEAQQLVGALENIGSFGRKSMNDLGESTIAAANGFRNMRSVTLEMNGVMGTIQQTEKDYTNAQSISTTGLNDQQKARALYNSILAQSAKEQGNLALYAQTAAGQQEIFNNRVLDSKIVVGEALLPAIGFLRDGFLHDLVPATQAGSSNIQMLQGTFLALATGIRWAVDAVVGFAKMFVGALESLRDGSMAPLDKAWTGTVNSMQQTWTDYNTGIKKIASGTWSQLSAEAIKAAREEAAAHKAALDKMNEQLADANRSFKEADAARKQSFEDSLRDMVSSHQDKVNTIKGQLADEQSAYDASVKQRQENYKEQVASVEDAHVAKVADITDRISEERAKGVYVDGILYSQGNKKRLEILQDGMEKENAAYAVHLTKLKDKNDDEVKNAQSAYDKKREKLQDSLNKEQSILVAHAADVARVGEQQKADDITRLERKFAEESSKAQIHYNDQVEKIRDAATRQGVASASGFSSGAGAQAPVINEQFRRMGSDVGANIADGIKKGVQEGLRSFTGDIGHWLTSSSKDSSTALTRGVGSFFSAINKFVNDSAKAGGGPVSGGQPYLVGEEGPELIVPSQSGTVVPHKQTMNMLNNTGASIHIENFHSYSPSDATAFADQLSWRLS